MGTSRLLLKGLGATIRQFTSHQSSLGTSHTVNPLWRRYPQSGHRAQEKTGVAQFLSSVFLSAERSPQSRGCCFSNLRTVMVRRRQAYPRVSLAPLPRRLLAEDETDESLAHNAKTQHQPPQPVLPSVCADCLPHTPLPPKRGGGSSSNPYCYVTVKPKGLLKGKKNPKRTVPKTRFQTSAVSAAISFTSQLAFCCYTHELLHCPFHLRSPQGCVISRRTYLEQFRSRCQFCQVYLQVKTCCNLHLQ